MPPTFSSDRILRIFFVLFSLVLSQCKGDALLDLPPSLSADLADIDFGSVELEQIARQEVTLRNTGGGSLEVELFLDQETQAKGFALENSLSQVKIPGQEEITVGILFTPTTIGMHAGTLSLKAGNAESTITLNLIGNGTGAALCTWPYAQLDFGDVQQDVELTQQIAFDNCGTATLCIDGFNWSTESSPAFSLLDFPETTHCLESGEVLVVNVAFQANSLGIHEATLEVFSDTMDGITELSIKGNALPPSACLNATPSALNFNATDPQILVGSTRSETLRVENCSTWDILLSHAEITGPGAEAFSFEILDESLPLNMPNQTGEANFNITFNALEAQAYQASLVLYHCLNCDEDDETRVAVGSIVLQGAAEIPCVPTSNCCGETCETEWELVRNGHFSLTNPIETSWDDNVDTEVKHPKYWQVELEDEEPIGGSYLGDGVWPDFETSPQHWMESYYDNVWYGNGMIFHKKLNSTSDTWDFVSQDINLDVSLCTSLRLSMDGRINNQSKSGIGNGEGTWPLMVRITYIDQEGVVHDNFSSAETSLPPNSPRAACAASPGAASMAASRPSPSKRVSCSSRMLPPPRVTKVVHCSGGKSRGMATPRPSRAKTREVDTAPP